MLESEQWTKPECGQFPATRQADKLPDSGDSGRQAKARLETGLTGTNMEPNYIFWDFEDLLLYCKSLILLGEP